MPRRKTLSDEAVLEGAVRVMFRKGPADFTLADVAAEVGIAPATLIQRFGDKHSLVVKAITRDNERVLAMIAAAPRARSAAAVIALFRMMTPNPAQEGGLADQFLWLSLDMRDPALNALARQRFDLLRTAVAERLPPLALPPSDAARLIEGQWQGAMIQWGVEPRGHLVDYVTTALANWFAMARS